MAEKSTSTPESTPTTVTITSTVDPMWIEFITQSTDIFMRGYCGYWLRGVELDLSRGWLAWEDDEKHEEGEEPNREEAIAAWENGQALPEGWFRLDTAMAAKMWGEGVRWKGEGWYEHGDANDYDHVVQQALLGEQRYG